jgi:hypothetical protein
MSQYPFKVIYKTSGKTATLTLYAYNYEHAFSRFWDSEAGREYDTSIVDIQLDVQQAETDLALYLAYRYRQLYTGEHYDRRLREVLNSCRLNPDYIREPLAKFGFQL